MRIGTPALTTRGFTEADFRTVAELVDRGVRIAVDLKGKTPGDAKLKDFLAFVGDGSGFPEIAQLRADDWLGAPTRALWVDFSVYNANINRFCVVRLLFERLHNGGVMPYAQVCDDGTRFRTAHGPHSCPASHASSLPPPQVRSLHLLWYARSDWLLVLIPECTLMLLVVYVT